MAKQPGLDFQSAKGGLGELKRRLLFVIGALIVFRIGSFIPIPGIDATVLAKLLEQQRGTIIEMFNMFSGGALSRASIFALGIMPYISASIIIQLLTVVHPALAEIKKEGEAGRRKISQYTRYGTLVLAIFQSIGIATGLPNMPGMQGLVINPGFAFYFTAVVSLVTGTMFLMWLGEQITERGIGNGISIIIFAGIVAGLPPAIAHTIEQARQGDLHFLLLLLVAVLVFAVTFFVVFIERGQRRIVVNYANVNKVVVLCSTEHTLTVESEYGWGYPCNLRFQHNSVSCHDCIMVWGRNRLELADDYFDVFAAGTAALCVTLCVCNHLLLFLLHGVSVQPA